MGAGTAGPALPAAVERMGSRRARGAVKEASPRRTLSTNVPTAPSSLPNPLHGVTSPVPSTNLEILLAPSTVQAAGEAGSCQGQAAAGTSQPPPPAWPASPSPAWPPAGLGVPWSSEPCPSCMGLHRAGESVLPPADLGSGPREAAEVRRGGLGPMAKNPGNVWVSRPEGVRARVFPESVHIGMGLPACCQSGVHSVQGLEPHGWAPHPSHPQVGHTGLISRCLGRGVRGGTVSHVPAPPLQPPEAAPAQTPLVPRPGWGIWGLSRSCPLGWIEAGCSLKFSKTCVWEGCRLEPGEIQLGQASPVPLSLLPWWLRDQERVGRGGSHL